MSGRPRRASLAALLAFCMSAAAGEPAVELTAAKAEVGVGEPVVLTLVYRWPKGWTTVTAADPAAELGSVFVSDLPPPTVQDTAEESRRQFAITVVPTRSGPWELPRPGFTVRSPAGVDRQVQAPSVVVQVGAGATDAALPAPRAAWGEAQAPPRRRWAWWVAGGAAALIAAGVAAWLRRRRRPPPVPPGAVARRALAAAAAIADPREAGTAASLALRAYAGATWSFDGAGATARECAAHLRRLGERAPGDEVAALLRLLGGLDDLRWAPGDVEAAPVQALIRDGQAWVEAVERRLAAAAAAAAGGRA